MSNDTFGENPDLPEDIREIFMWLCQDVASLNQKWGFYLELFSKPENADLLSRLARASFQLIEESLRNDMTMAICRLSDPPQTSGRDNLSIPAFIKRYGKFDAVSEPLDQFLAACEPIRRYRNKRVGHNDLNTTIAPHDNPLPGIGRRNIDDIVKLAGRVLNTINQRHSNFELFFTPVARGGADELMFWLKTGRDFEAGRGKSV